jgi:hypothetical protein
VVTGMCGTGTVTGGGAKHVGEWRAGAEATTVDRAWPFGYFTATKRDARRQQRRISCRSGEALFEHWLKIKNRGSASGETRVGPTHGDKEFKQKRLAV